MTTVKRRIRNILCLDDKIRVIKAYSDQPCYQKLANIFKCSGKQIKYIILNKKKILAEYALVQSKLARPKKTVQQLDYTKIALIDKVMFEWYQRAKCYPSFGRGPISYKTIREKVLDTRKALNIASFIPTNAWLVNFRNDCDRHPPDRNRDEKKLLSLDMKVIAKCVLQQLGITMEQMKSTYGIGANDEKLIKAKPVPMETVPSSTEDSLNLCQDVDVSAALPKSMSEDCKDSDGISEISVKEEKPDYQFIKSSQDALKYLKPLEDFVLLKENFRAIGLITQLEAIFLKTSKNQCVVD